MSEETVKVGYEFRKIFFYEGEFAVPKSIFNEGKVALENYLIDNSCGMDENSEELEIDGIGTGCYSCSNEITHTDQITHIDDFIICDECANDEGE